jgi:hypothetical protein
VIIDAYDGVSLQPVDIPISPEEYKAFKTMNPESKRG